MTEAQIVFLWHFLEEGSRRAEVRSRQTFSRSMLTGKFGGASQCQPSG